MSQDIQFFEVGREVVRLFKKNRPGVLKIDRDNANFDRYSHDLYVCLQTRTGSAALHDPLPDDFFLNGIDFSVSSTKVRSTTCGRFHEHVFGAVWDEYDQHLSKCPVNVGLYHSDTITQSEFFYRHYQAQYTGQSVQTLVELFAVILKMRRGQHFECLSEFPTPVGALLNDGELAHLTDLAEQAIVALQQPHDTTIPSTVGHTYNSLDANGKSWRDRTPQI